MTLPLDSSKLPSQEHLIASEASRLQEDALLKCPFCNGEAEIINCSVHCNNPWCEAQPFTAGQSEAEAIAAWNRRAVGGGLQVQPAPRNFDAERAAWLADKIVAHGDYAKEAAEMLLRWPLAVRSETKDVQEDAPRDTAGVRAAPACRYPRCNCVVKLDGSWEGCKVSTGVASASQASDFNPDWSMLEATQESLREHMGMIRDLQSRVAAAAILAKQVSSALAEANVPASVKNDIHELRRALFIPGSAGADGVRQPHPPHRTCPCAECRAYPWKDDGGVPADAKTSDQTSNGDRK